ncbi:MAG: hypothetical protein AAF762_01790 [Pseudomonadota bacterium]
MRLVSVSSAFVFMACTAASADAIADSCRFLDIVGGEKRALVEPMFSDLASGWPQESRANAVASVEAVIDELAFAGGNVYELARLGEDYADHLIAIRLAGGELTAARLTYEYAPTGLRLTGMNFKRRMSEMLPVGALASLEPVVCPDG